SQFEAVYEGFGGDVFASPLQYVEHVKFQSGVLFCLNTNGVFGARGEDGDDGLKGGLGGWGGGIDLFSLRRQFAVEGGSRNRVQSLDQVGHVVLVFAEPVGEVTDGSSRQTDLVSLDVQEHPHTIQLGLHAPVMVVVFEARGFFGVEVLPVRQKHRLDLFR